MVLMRGLHRFEDALIVAILLGMMVLAADPAEHGLTLQNTFARQEAERLLAESADYF